MFLRQVIEPLDPFDSEGRGRWFSIVQDITRQKAAEALVRQANEALEERVRKLQTGYGIKPDGVVGPETLFALSALDESGPHLFRTIE